MAAWRWQAHTLYLGDFWSSTFFYPHHWVAAYTEHVAPLMPFYTFAEWLTGSSIAAYNAIYLSLFVAAATAACILALKITRSWPAAFVAGLIFGFSPFKFGQTTHLHISAIFLMPIALLLLRELIRRPRVVTAIWLGLVWAIQTLISYYVGFMLLLAMAAYGLAGLILERRVGSRGERRKAVMGTIAYSGIAILLGLVLIAPLTWPYFTSVREEVDQTRSIEEISTYSISPLDPVRPSARAEIEMPAPLGRNPSSETQFYIGFAAGILALAGLTLGRWRESLRWLAVVFTGFLMALGPYKWGVPLPYRAFLTLPGFKGLRVPGRFAAVFFLGIAVLAAMGAAALWRRGKLWKVIVIGLGALVVTEFAVALPVTEPMPGRLAEMPSYVQWLRDAPPGPVVEIPMYRSTVSGSVRQAYRQYLGTYDWNPRVNGYSGYTPRDYPELVEVMRVFPESTSPLDALGVRYVVIHYDELASLDETNSGLPTPDQMRTALAANPRFKPVFADGPTEIYELAP